MNVVAQPAPVLARDDRGRWLLRHRQWRLANGLRVVCAPDPSARNVAIAMYYHVGASDEAAPCSGRAHLFEHVFKNSLHVPRHHYEILRDAGAHAANAATGYDYTMYYEVVPQTQVELALWLESDRMGYWAPGMTEARLAAQREVVLSERAKRYDATPYGPERLAANRMMFSAGTPLAEGVIGAADDIAAATLNDLLGHYQRWYGPANAVLSLTGGIDEQEAERLVERYFGTFPASARPMRAPPGWGTLPAAAGQGAASRAVRATEVVDALAAHRRWRWMWRAPAMPSREAAALEAFAALWSRRGTGDLWKTLMYGVPAAQRISAATTSHRTCGEFHVVVDLLPHADADAVAALVQASMTRELAAIDGATLAGLRARREARFLRTLEPPPARGELLQHAILRHGDGSGYLIDMELRDAVAVADVRSTVARYLDWSEAMSVRTTLTT